MFELTEGEPLMRYKGEEGDIIFVRRCPQCGRFVRADEIGVGQNLAGYCKKCGIVKLTCLGYVD